MNNKNSFRPRLLRLLLLIGGVAALAVLTPIARASTITVSTTDDEVNGDGDCSLREAIIAANTDTAVDTCPAGNGADDINLPAGTYMLAIGGSENGAQTRDLDISDDLTLTGAGWANTIIDANALDRVFTIDANSTVQFSGVTITGGFVDQDGGGVYISSSGALTTTNSLIGWSPEVLGVTGPWPLR